MELFRVEVHPRVIKIASKELEPAYVKKLVKFLETAKIQPYSQRF
ncbi:MAG: hypothetical protein ABGW92_01005 [Methanocaldococcus sp.]